MLHPHFLGWCFFQSCSTKAPCPSIYGPRKSAINPENSAITTDRKRRPREFCHQTMKSAITTGRKRWPRKICHQPMKSCQRSQSNSAIGPENSAITTLENSDQWIPAIGPENSAITTIGKRWPKKFCHQPREFCHHYHSKILAKGILPSAQRIPPVAGYLAGCLAGWLVGWLAGGGAGAEQASRWQR